MLKRSISGIIAVVTLFISTPAQAQEFDRLLQQLLTPEEVALHQERGNAKAVELARQACSALKAGASVQDLALQVSQSLSQEGLAQDKLEMTATYTGKVIAAGVASFCPEYTSTLQEAQP